ncbi:armadillo-type fold protein [Artemisia annua]|uniref:Armadillo-type fold protein n=1 Tax=Artemisia annua TaxID=35608 RepID=A0A2U1M3D6_ARTAN|nr:armadillo-type fold protein [Artemisia annua]
MKMPENQQTSGENNPKPPLELIESLLESINQTQTLKLKWSLIKTKLSNLKTNLLDLATFPPTSISNELLRSLTVTLSEALTLSLTCHTSNPSSGKLKTQSDIDSIASKLEFHIRDLHVIIESGVLQENNVSTASKREGVRIHARDMITRLQIGSTESRAHALDSVLQLLEKDDKNVVIAVGQGIVPVLVRLLDSGSSAEVREKTVMVIARVSGVESCRNALVNEACVTLQSLTLLKENAVVISSRGGVSLLLKICESGTPTAQACAAGVLRNISGFSDTRECFMEDHVILVLLTLASSGILLAQEHSLACLSNLIRDDDDLILLVARKGGIDCLKTFWDDSGVVAQSLEVAVEFLCNLASEERLIELIISNGFLFRLVRVLNCGVLSVRIHAANTIYKMGYNEKTRKELGDFGFIPLLIRMLDGKAIEEAEAASKALSAILIYTENTKIYKKDQRGIASVVRLLDPLVTGLDKKYPVSILLSLTRSKKCRKQMVNSGALLHLEKLTAMEIEVTGLDKKYPVSILLSLTRSKKCRKQMVNSGALLHLEKLVAMETEDGLTNPVNG